MKILLTFLPLISTLLLSYQTMRAGFKFSGKSPLKSRTIYYIAKVIVAFSFGLTALASLFPNAYLVFPFNIQSEVPASQQLLAMIFLFAGNALLLSAQYELSIFTRVGLPTSAHALCTSGVYRWSRNPMYASLLFFFSACFMLNPSVEVAVLLSIGLIIHLPIIKAEEKYLAKEFGKEYAEYQKKTARFL